MNATTMAAKLIVDGVISIPDALDSHTLAAAEAAFEALCEKHGTRKLGWDQLCADPAIMACIAPPRMMAVINAFGRHFGEDMVFTNCAGMRDVYDGKRSPADPIPPDTQIGWHDDVTGVTKPRQAAMQLGITTLIYFDATYPENGAYYGAIGSHHLATYPPEDPMAGPRYANHELVFDACELRPFPASPGTAVLHRSHSWHGVMPPCQRRRILLHTFGAASSYDLQLGHTQVSDETLAIMPPDRRPYIRRYQTV